jgi:hypothetical protein
MAPTVLTLEFMYYLDGERADLISVSDDIGTLAYKKARCDRKYLARWYLSSRIYDLPY